MTVPERPTRILLVDDEEQIRRALKSILGTRGYMLDVATTADEALTKAIDDPPDLVVLDLCCPTATASKCAGSCAPGWPRRSSSSRCAPPKPTRSRPWTKAPTTTSPSPSRQASCWPASGRCCDGRRRSPRRRRSSLAGELEIDIARRRVTLSGGEVALTPTEFDILAFLARNADLVVTQKMILEHVWGPEWVEDAQTLRVHVSHLRKKIEPSPAGARYIITEPGVGFRLSVPEADTP